MLNVQFCILNYMNELFWLTLLLFVIAAALRSELLFYLLSVLVGLQVLARLWLRRDVKQLSWRRRAPLTAFPGERTIVEIELNKNGLLPSPWLPLTGSVPDAPPH